MTLDFLNISYSLLFFHPLLLNLWTTKFFLLIITLPFWQRSGVRLPTLYSIRFRSEKKAGWREKGRRPAYTHTLDIHRKVNKQRYLINILIRKRNQRLNGHSKKLEFPTRFYIYLHMCLSRDKHIDFSLKKGGEKQELLGPVFYIFQIINHGRKRNKSAKAGNGPRGKRVVSLFFLPQPILSVRVD